MGCKTDNHKFVSLLKKSDISFHCPDDADNPDQWSDKIYIIVCEKCGIKQEDIIHNQVQDLNNKEVAANPTGRYNKLEI